MILRVQTGASVISDWDIDGDTQYGFKWGPVAVERLAEFPRSGGQCKVMGLYRVKGPTRADMEQVLEIYVSPTGRSVRVFRNGKELKES